jgi:hypothetical protein
MKTTGDAATHNHRTAATGTNKKQWSVEQSSTTQKHQPPQRAMVQARRRQISGGKNRTSLRRETTTNLTTTTTNSKKNNTHAGSCDGGFGCKRNVVRRTDQNEITGGRRKQRWCGEKLSLHHLSMWLHRGATVWKTGDKAVVVWFALERY